MGILDKINKYIGVFKVDTFEEDGKWGATITSKGKEISERKGFETEKEALGWADRFIKDENR